MERKINIRYNKHNNKTNKKRLVWQQLSNLEEAIDRDWNDGRGVPGEQLLRPVPSSLTIYVHGKENGTTLSWSTDETFFFFFCFFLCVFYFYFLGGRRVPINGFRWSTSICLCQQSRRTVGNEKIKMNKKKIVRLSLQDIEQWAVPPIF